MDESEASSHCLGVFWEPEVCKILRYICKIFSPPLPPPHPLYPKNSQPSYQRLDNGFFCSLGQEARLLRLWHTTFMVQLALRWRLMYWQEKGRFYVLTYLTTVDKGKRVTVSHIPIILHFLICILVFCCLSHALFYAWLHYLVFTFLTRSCMQLSHCTGFSFSLYLAIIEWGWVGYEELCRSRRVSSVELSSCCSYYVFSQTFAVKQVKCSAITHFENNSNSSPGLLL